MYVMNCEQVKHKDTMAMIKYGIPGVLLMEHAALAVYHEMEKHNLLYGKILVICGKGNNGGDGYSLARLLYQKGVNVSLLNLFNTPPKTADASVFYQMTQKLGVPYGEHTDIENADVIVDAIFGIGMKQALNDFCVDIIEKINRSKAKKISIDLPSGMDGDESYQKNPMVNADLTVTFTAYKPGLIFYPSAYSAGKVILADIGIPVMLGDDRTRIIDFDLIRNAFPKRDNAGHKNTFGSILVTGGSTGMTGAVTLCATAALSCGCGLVNAAVPKSLHEIMEQKVTEVMTIPLDDHHTGHFDPAGTEDFLQAISKNDLVVFGPGAGTGSGTASLLHTLLQTKSNIIIDADGLNVLAQHMDWFIDRECEHCILTPHPKEMSRLSGVSVAEIEENRIEFARDFAQKYKVTLVLKGARTVVATPTGQVYVNLYGNSGMATAGSGDVLAGAIGSFFVQGMTETDAAVCAVAIHALAGDCLKSKIGEYGITAGELSRQIPVTIKEILEVELC